MRKKKNKFGLFLVVVIFSVVYAGYELFLKPHVNKGADVVIIPKGSGISRIAQILDEADAVYHPNIFKTAAKISGYDTKLRAGKFKLPEKANNWELLQLLSSGKPYEEKVTLPEGLMSKQMASILQEKASIDSMAFMNAVMDSSLAKELGVDAENLEGYLFPETYHITWGASGETVARQLVKQFFIELPDSAKEKAKELGCSLHQMVTLASIIEGEAIKREESEIISAVYHNRLKKRIRLEADPTIQYIIPDGPRRLLHKDLEIDSPYNTYKYYGLPPGPIKNPGRNAIAAALNPAEVPYLFFVAKGDGSHVFSTTYQQHLRAKSDFDKVRRRVAREKRMQGK